MSAFTDAGAYDAGDDGNAGDGGSSLPPGCGRRGHMPVPGATPAPICSAAQGDAGAAATLAASDQAFAATLYEPAVTAVGTGQNVVFSPYSLSTVLEMVDVGAAGNTDAQMRTVLQLSDSAANLASAYAALACANETDGSSQGDTLTMANAVWGQAGVPFQSSFLSTLSTGYGAPLEQVDFAGNPSGALAGINQWVSTNTQGIFPMLLQPGDVDTTTRIVLVDAIYFKGTWMQGFDPAQTAPRPFFLSDGTQVTVPTMLGTVAMWSGSASGVAVDELGYKDGALAMDFVFPTSPASSLTELESTLTPAVLQAALASISAYSSLAKLQVPKFSFRTQLALAPILTGMGMTDLFENGVANLSGIDGQMDLYVRTVVQQAMVEVDETGTVASAATGAVGNCTFGIAEPIVVTIDHPFLFLIRDTQSGSILFMGRVEDPRQQG
jgi:serpin B